MGTPDNNALALE